MGIYSENLASIGDTVWYDDNRDGIQDETEKGVEAVKVTLYNGLNEVVNVTSTDRQGIYQFRGLTPGIYSLEFSNLPIDYIITKQVDSPTKGSDANPSTGKTVTTELIEGEVDLSWDMGIYSNSLAMIGDAVWYDDNRDGIQDIGEKGVEAIRVTLYKDNCSNKFKVTTTDRDGIYQFRDLSAGDYCLGFEDLPVGYLISPLNTTDDTKDSDVDITSGKTKIITLLEGEHNLSFDMGIYAENVAIIGDAVWYDDNRNGIQDSFEKGVEAIQVNLYNSDDKKVASTTTDEDGNYQFRDLVPASYYLQLNNLPVGYEITLQNVGENNTINSDADATGKTALTELTEGEVDLSWDMGIFNRQRGSIGNHVWYDDNRNGIQDESEKGVEAIKVILYDASENILKTTQTDTNGIYQFRDLLPGGYYIAFSDLPVGYEITEQNVGNDALKDSDADTTTGMTVVTLLSEGENDISWDMGIYNRLRASIGDSVWYDDNKNGIQDSNEYGVPAVKVILYTEDGKKVATVVTDEQGNYKFGNLLPRAYYLEFSDLPIGYKATKQNVSSKEKDSDADVITLKTKVTVLEEGENDLSWDLGIHNALRATIGDTVWYDDNKNGIQDTYEFGVRAVKLKLYNSKNKQVAETVSDDKGNYLFRNLVPDSYYIMVSDLPAGYEVTLQDVGNDEKDSDISKNNFITKGITVIAGQNDLSWDMGIFNKEKASLGNKVWYDRNHDGIQDINETGVSAVKITLYDKENKIVRTTRTNEYGEYIFRDLVPSEYFIEFSEFPAGYMITKQNFGEDSLLDSDANYHRGQTVLITLEAGETDLSWDVGLYIPTLVDFGNKVWDDVNFNGIQDNNEAGLANVKVTLVKNGILQIPSEQTTTATTSVYTDSNGHYIFQNIEAFSPHQYHVILDHTTFIQGSTFSPLNQGDNEEMDSNMNPDSNKTIDVILSNNDDLTHDIGVIIFRTFNDTVTANTTGAETIINILNNDSENTQNGMILFVELTEGTILNDDGTAVAGTSLITSDIYVVEGEGTWRVVDGNVTFTAENGFDGIPTPVYYIVQGDKGNQSNVSTIVISSPCICDTYEESSSVPTLTFWSILFMISSISLLGLLLVRREFED
jgi:protocatechuate 3,4-dioxygenase beta subunit